MTFDKAKIEYDLYSSLCQEAKEECEKSFYNFFIHSWNVMEPHTELKSNWHIGLIAEYLEAVHHRQIQRLIVNIPTRYLKSKEITIAYPAWVWTQQAWHKFICSSYADDLSSKLSYSRRQLIESDWYEMNWGDKVKLQPDQNQKTFYQNTEMGSMNATSTGGSITGEGCNTMIIDDPTKPQEAISDNVRERAITHWKSTLSSRFDDPKTSALILVMQRLHTRDLTGYMVAEEGDCEHLVIPNTCEKQTIYTYPMSGRIKVYEKDEILQPDREGEAELKKAKIALGSWHYAAQRQQRPVPLKGGMVQRNWFKRYEELPDIRIEYQCISVDCTFKDLESSDFVAIQVWNRYGPKKYLVRRVKAKLGFLATCATLEKIIKVFPNYTEILIEEAANGNAVIETLQEKFSNVIAIKTGGESKVSRFNACTPTIEAGDVHIPDELFNPGTKVYLDEVCTFPKAPNDDEVDSTSQALNRMREKNIGQFEEENDTNKDTEMEEITDDEGGTLAGSLHDSDSW